MKKVLMGLVLAGLFTPVAAWAQYLYQEHYRWRNDNGSESAATWMAAADTQRPSIGQGVERQGRHTSQAASGLYLITLE